MGAVLPSYPPASLRAKPLPRVAAFVSMRHIQSETRGPWRSRSRELLDQAMHEARAVVLDVADALDVDARNAGRAVSGEKPFDLGDVLALAASGPGGVRLARRLLSLLRDEIDRIEAGAALAAGR